MVGPSGPKFITPGQKFLYKYHRGEVKEARWITVVPEEPAHLLFHSNNVLFACSGIWTKGTENHTR